MLTDIGLLVGVLVLGCAVWMLWARGDRRRERGLALGVAVVALVLTGDIVRSEIVARRAAWEAERALAWSDFNYHKQMDFSDLQFRSDQALNDFKFKTEQDMNAITSSAEMEAVGPAISGNKRAVDDAERRAHKQLVERAAAAKQEAAAKGAAFAAEQKRLEEKYRKAEADLRKHYGPPPS